MPQVSVIVPTYNHEQFVARAVDSVLAQTYPDIQVVVVDDGSTDQTRTVLSRYEGRISTIRQSNQGAAAARNAGLAASQGDYVLFLDADDWIPANKLEIQVSRLEARPDYGVVYAGWQFVNGDGSQVLGEMRPRKEGQLLKDLLCRSFVLATMGAAVIRRQCFERAGLFDESLVYVEDVDMWTRIARAGYSFGYVDELLLRYRIHRDSMSSQAERFQKYTRHEMARLDKFFADPDLPQEISSLEPEVYGIAHYEAAARYYRVGEIELGREHIAQATSASPALAANRDWLLEWLAGAALEPRTVDPEQFIRRVLNNLPRQAGTLESLGRRAQGHYHVAAAFAEHQNGHYRNIRAHILPAVLGKPSVLRNRGFLRIAAQAWLGS